MIYADNAATTLISERAKSAMIDAMRFYNPSSPHAAGVEARMTLERARADVAACINAQPDEIVFTSGATESNRIALQSLQQLTNISTLFEHSSVYWGRGYRPLDCFLPIKEDGVIDCYKSIKILVENTNRINASIIFAQNIIGTIQPIKDMTKMFHSFMSKVHTDATQAIGQIPVDVKDLDVDMLSASAHKFHGPRGVGFLYIKDGTIKKSKGQEFGIRHGTENIPGIVGMAEALKERCENMESNMAITRDRQRLLIDELSKIPNSALNGSLEYRLPGNVNFFFEGVNGEALMHYLNMRDIYVSTTSACEKDADRVFRAIGHPERANSSIRITFDESMTVQNIRTIAEAIKEGVNVLRGK